MSTRDSGPDGAPVLRLALGELGRLGLGHHAGDDPAATVEAAIRHYSRHFGSGRAAYMLPQVCRERCVGPTHVEVDPRIEPETRAALEREADRQNLTLERLVEHVLFVYLADLERSDSA